MITIASTLFVGCKETASNPNTIVADSEIETVATTEKKQVAAVQPETASFKIEGMTCAMGCAKTIEKKLAEMNGVQKATVDFETKEAVVEFDATIQTKESLTKVIEASADGKTYKVAEDKTATKV